MKSLLHSPVISKYISQEKIDLYKSDLDRWLAKYDVSGHLGPADHVAIKVENEAALYEVTEAIKPFCVDCVGKTPGLTIRNMHGRRITVALLKEPLFIGNDPITCIEIMQPRPEVEGKSVLGFDHFELINPNLDEVEEHLKEKGADYYIDTTNPYKHIVVAFVNDRQERIKFTNKTLAEVVSLQILGDPSRTEILLS